MSEDELAFQEPRKVFINLIIIPHMRFISELLISKPSKALGAMRTLIDNLDEYSQKTLGDLYKELWDCEYHSRRATKYKIERIYRTLSVFLHKHYLKEYGVKPWHPKPTHIRKDKIDGRA